MPPRMSMAGSRYTALTPLSRWTRSCAADARPRPSSSRDGTARRTPRRRTWTALGNVVLCVVSPTTNGPSARDVAVGEVEVARRDGCRRRGARRRRLVPPAGEPAERPCSSRREAPCRRGPRHRRGASSLTTPGSTASPRALCVDWLVVLRRARLPRPLRTGGAFPGRCRGTARRRRCGSRTASGLAERLHGGGRVGERAHARQHDGVGACAMSGGIVGDPHVAARRRQPALDALEVPLVVVDHDDRIHLRAALRGGQRRRRCAGFERDSAARQGARPAALNEASTMWCAFSPAEAADVQRHAGVRGERDEELLGERGVERADDLDGQRPRRSAAGRARKRRTAASTSASSIGTNCEPKRAMPRLSPSACANGLAQHDARVLHRVVRVHVDVALARARSGRSGRGGRRRPACGRRRARPSRRPPRPCRRGPACTRMSVSFVVRTMLAVRCSLMPVFLPFRNRARRPGTHRSLRASRWSRAGSPSRHRRTREVAHQNAAVVQRLPTPRRRAPGGTARSSRPRGTASRPGPSSGPRTRAARSAMMAVMPGSNFARFAYTTPRDGLRHGVDGIRLAHLHELADDLGVPQQVAHAHARRGENALENVRRMTRFSCCASAGRMVGAGELEVRLVHHHERVGGFAAARRGTPRRPASPWGCSGLVTTR